MPTYDYECQKCGYNFEMFQGINDPPRSRCPKCRGKVQRLIGNGVGIVFKGSGFYVTDSRRSAQAQGKTNESSSSGDSSSGSTQQKGASDSTDKSRSEKSKAGKSKTEGSKTAKAKTA
jgi:putative FmdB family regulatory protein